MRDALKYVLPITLIAMGLAWISEQVALLFGIELPEQDLVKLFTNPNVAWSLKAKIGLVAVIVCPPLEEAVFRGFLCKWLFARWMAYRWAAGLSALLFAAAHLHIATFIPLLWLGLAFAWLYWRTGTLKSPILCHAIFNIINLVLCLTIGAD